MRILFTVLFAASGIAAAQQLAFDDPESESWFQIPFEQRGQLFEDEVRDADWAPAMESMVEQTMGSLARPRLDGVECRSTLCKVELSWSSHPKRAEIGITISYLYGIGIDHQGEVDIRETENRYQVEVIGRRMTDDFL